MNQPPQTMLQQLNLMAEDIPEHRENLSLEVAEELMKYQSELERLDSKEEKLKANLKLKTELPEQKKTSPNRVMIREAIITL